MELITIAWIVVISLQVITMVSGGIAYIKITKNDLKHLNKEVKNVKKEFNDYKDKLDKKIGKIFDRIEKNSKDIAVEKALRNQDDN